MTSSLLAVKKRVSRYYHVALAVGLTLVAILNWRAWQRDSAESLGLDSDDSASSLSTFSDLPEVSVLVAAWNEARHIDAHIRSFLALHYPSIELIICAGGTDGTFRRAMHYAGPRVKVLEQRPGEGKQRALANCFKHASAEIIYLTDADCIYRDDALYRLLSPIAAEGEGAATGTSRPLDDQRDSVIPSHLRAIELASGRRYHGYIRGLLGRNAMLTRESINRIGGLDFYAPTGTDYHLGQRLLAQGIRIRYVPESVVPSEYPDNIGEYRNKQSRWLRNLILFGNDYGADADVAETRKTIALGIVMMLMPIAALLFGRLVLVVWSILLAHASLARIRYMALWSRFERRPFPKLYPLIVVLLTLLDFAVSALPAVDLLDNRKRRKW